MGSIRANYPKLTDDIELRQVSCHSSLAMLCMWMTMIMANVITLSSFWRTHSCCRCWLLSSVLLTPFFVLAIPNLLLCYRKFKCLSYLSLHLHRHFSLSSDIIWSCSRLARQNYYRTWLMNNEQQSMQKMLMHKWVIHGMHEAIKKQLENIKIN